MRPYTDISALRHIYLEDSWVLGIDATPGRLSFRMDLVLTPEHPEYRAAAPGEQHCYGGGELSFTGVSRLQWLAADIRPGVDASGEHDYGNIDIFEWDERAARLEGDWGQIEVSYAAVEVSLDDSADAAESRRASAITEPQEQEQPGTGRTVELSEGEVVTVFRVLNEVVVSLDRIGSREAGGEDPERSYIDGYFSEDGATLRLAEARSVINSAVERVFGEDELNRVDETIVYWTDLHPDLLNRWPGKEPHCSRREGMRSAGPAKEVLTVMHRGSEELPGLIFYGLFLEEPDVGSISFPTDAWPESLEPDDLLVHGDGWRVSGWELPILSWPSGDVFRGAIRRTLSTLIIAGATVAWVGAEGIPFVDPPDIFDPGFMAGGVLAWLTDDDHFACPLDPDGPLTRATDDELSYLSAHVKDN